MRKVVTPKPAQKKSDQKPKLVLFPNKLTGKQLLDKLGIVTKKV